jgi:hypothetical protein
MPHESVTWQDPELRVITRIRLLRFYRGYDVHYALGRLISGREVGVDLPFLTLPRRKFLRAIVSYAKRDGALRKLGSVRDLAACISIG